MNEKMNTMMDNLALSIKNLETLNNTILYSINTKYAEKDRVELINKIDHQCKMIQPKLDHPTDQEYFVNLIKKYLMIQENYKNNKKKLFETQLLLRDPNLTQIQIHDIISSTSDRDVLCLVDMYHDVKNRYKEILKLERDIEEIKELFIGMYAIVDHQGEKIDQIANHVAAAKTECHTAKEDLVVAYKMKRKWFHLF